MKALQYEDDVEEEVHNFLLTHDLCKKSRVAVAFSGGVDSSVLLFVLSSLHIFPSLRAIHVSHGIRDEHELEAEKRILHSTCERLQIPLEIRTISRGAIERFAKEHGSGVEDAARSFRYAALIASVKQNGDELLLSAHNQDDELETLLSRFLNGSALEGFEAIHETVQLCTTCVLARPMLSVNRAAIENYARIKDIHYSYDTTNADTRFYRNRIRAKLTPLLDLEFRGWRTGVLKTAQKLLEDKESIEKDTRALVEQLQFTGSGKAEIPYQSLISAPAAIARRVLLYAVSQLKSTCRQPCLECTNPRDQDMEFYSTERLSSRAVDEALALLHEGKRSFRMLGCETEVRAGVVTIKVGLDFVTEESYFFDIEHPTKAKVGALSIQAFWKDGSCLDEESQGSALIDEYLQPGRKDKAPVRVSILENAFTFPLVVRSRHPGDHINLTNGQVAVDELVKSWHLEQYLRRLPMVIEDRNGIVAVFSWPSDASDRKSECRFRRFDGPKSQKQFIVDLNLEGE
ncbi:MAG TPA: tRNA lysidine(34) synthetase TilS [Spirochaetales bacterium]|nr:tRNA lysidine(34) synthetase TilS [Spirochaetales bacterium]